MSKISASLRITGKDLCPNELSELLKAQPNTFHKLGDQHLGKSGRKYTNYTSGLWSIESPLGSEMPIEDHLNYFIDWLKSRKTVLKLMKSKQFKIDIFIGIFIENGNYGFPINSEILFSFGTLEIGLEFDVYQLADNLDTLQK